MYQTTSNPDCSKYITSHVKAPYSFSVASARDNTSQYGADSTELGYYDAHRSLPLSSSLHVTHNTSGARPLHAMSTVDRTYGGSTGLTTYTYPYSSSMSSHGSYHTSGQATRSSRRDDYDRLQSSGVRHSSSAAASQNSAISRTGVYDTNRRYH